MTPLEHLILGAAIAVAIPLAIALGVRLSRLRPRYRRTDSRIGDR